MLNWKIAEYNLLNWKQVMILQTADSVNGWKDLWASLTIALRWLSSSGIIYKI